MLGRLRDQNISSEVFPESAKLKKQMTYADKKEIPFVLMIGSREIETGNYTLKNMSTGEQKELTLAEIIAELT